MKKFVAVLLTAFAVNFAGGALADDKPASPAPA